MIVGSARLLAILQLLPAPAIGGLRYSSAHEKLASAGAITEGKATKYEVQDGKAIKYELQEGKATKYEAQEGKLTKYEVQEGKATKQEMQEGKATKHGKEGRSTKHTMALGKMTRFGTQEGKTTRYAMQEGSTRLSLLEEQVGDRTALGYMNKMGVTRYKRRSFHKKKNEDGSFFWGDSFNRNGQVHSGAADLTENLSWAWHHTAGLYATIPVGAPLIDDEMNIYFGADDAIRKFSVAGDLIWSYAPRGQLAAACTLAISSSRRMSDSESDEEQMEEAMLRPDWDKGNESEPAVPASFVDLRIGDLVKVKPGARYMADGKELYKEGDQGMVSAIIDEGRDSRVVVQWGHTGHKTVVQLHAMKTRFVRAGRRQTAATGAMLVGSTTAGFVFALDLATGNELWATWASNEIAGVKGSVAANSGVVVVATDRCTDRYCYRYRNQTMPLTAGNSYVRGLSAADGTQLWEYRTVSPVWNMNPLFGNDGSVMFQDWEGRVYCLDLLTGAKRYQVGGDWGTHTNAAAVFSAGHNIVIAMGMLHYNTNNYHMDDAIGRTPSVKYCNPYPAPGILPHCSTWPGLRGFVRGYNASSGHRLWEKSTPEPPSGASIGQMASMGSFGTRLVLTMGHNCFHNSPTEIWLMDPNNGDIRWMRDGPTLWTSFCASDKEGADIRRAMGGRAECKPNSWSAPVLDSAGDVYVGNQVGILERIGAPNGGGTRDVQVISTLTTGAAFQDAAIAFADGVMAVSTCTSLMVFQTYVENFTNETWSYMPGSTPDFTHHQPSY